MKTGLLKNSINPIFTSSLLLPFLSVKEAVVSAFEDVTQWEKKVVAFGADGASVNLGEKGWSRCTHYKRHSALGRLSLSASQA